MRGLINTCEFPDYEIIKPTELIEPLTLEQCRNIDQTTDSLETFSPDDYLLYLKNLGNKFFDYFIY